MPRIKREKKVPVSFRLPKELKDKLDAKALEEKKTPTEVMRELLEKWLA